MRLGVILLNSSYQNIKFQRDKLRLEKIKKIETVESKGHKFLTDLYKLTKKRKKKDEIILTSVKNLCVSLPGLILQIKKLIDRGISIQFLDEGITIDYKDEIETPKIIDFFITFYQFREHKIQKERKAKKDRSNLQGRPDLLSQDNKIKLFKDYDKGIFSVVNLCRAYNISRNTFYRYLKAEREE